MRKIAIVGTAGRDKFRTMDLRLWSWMVNDATVRVPRDAHLVSGGAAWADHLAVHLFLSGHVSRLTLHLPAPFSFGGSPRFAGGRGSSGSAANYYHKLFSEVLGKNSLREIEEAGSMPSCDITTQKATPGYGGMFARNKLVAGAADLLLAYTFGKGEEPLDGGTKNTWDLCKGARMHIPLPTMGPAPRRKPK